MKSISDLFIIRPVMTTLVMLGILVFGYTAYRDLPVSDLPNVDYPTIQVSASLPGASPETMASAVATPLEKQFLTIDGIDSMTSSSNVGSTSITIQFSLSKNIDAAAQDVQSAITGVLGRLPKNMPTPPTYRKVNPAMSPILFIALTSKTLPLSELDEYAETLLAQQISTVSGVAQVNVYGAQKYAVRIQLDPNKLANKDISINQVAQAINNSNVNLPTGALYGPYTAYTIQANGQITEASGYRSLIVAYRNGNPVRLSELGDALDSVENDKTAAWYYNSTGSQRAMVLAVQRQPGTNTVAVASDVNNMIAKMKDQIPASVSLNTLFDRSDSISKSVRDVKLTLILTLFLVIMVIFIFLRNVSATIIPSLALPMSIVGTFAVMYLLDFSLDNLSLMALTLCVGFVVDDAIVMLENIVRHMEKGEKPYDAAIIGAREIGFTIISMTISLTAVFIPVLFMGGILGRLFHEFAVTIGIAILISGFVSLTLTPMMCSRFLKHLTDKKHGPVFNAFERFFQGMLNVYKVGLRWSLRHRLIVMIFSAGVLIATFYLYTVIPKGFIPSEDIGRIMVTTQAAQGTSLDSMTAHQQQAAAILQKDPDVNAFMSSVGGGRGASGTNSGSMMLTLKDKSKRESTVDQIIARLRVKLSQIPGLNVFLQNPPPISVGGTSSRSQYQVSIQGPDTTELYKYATIMEEKMHSLPGLTDISSDLEMKNPMVEVKINRDKAAALGATVEGIEETLSNAYGSNQISNIYDPTNTYVVILELKPEFRTDPSNLSLLYVPSTSGQLVPLSAVADISTDIGPLSINHTGQAISVTLSFNLLTGYSLGQAVTEINTLGASVLPVGITLNYQGTAQAFQSSMAGLGVLLIVAVLVIYMVLGILYESFIHPITILSALPFAGFGGLVTLLIFNVELSIYAFVGIIMLIGLVKKNGIMMVDFALEAQRSRKLSAEDAIFDACVVRFRPIMMTTMAALIGTLPIALGLGSGAESRQPLGLAVVGGLFFSQLFTLFVTPVFFIYMEHFRMWVGRHFSSE
jgi:hydrophobic/amphiphilic exporter-1 (mainly G- bacteria), HAE1 family